MATRHEQYVRRLERKLWWRYVRRSVGRVVLVAAIVGVVLWVVVDAWRWLLSDFGAR